MLASASPAPLELLVTAAGAVNRLARVASHRHARPLSCAGAGSTASSRSALSAASPPPPRFPRRWSLPCIRSEAERTAAQRGSSVALQPSLASRRWSPARSPPIVAAAVELAAYSPPPPPLVASLHAPPRSRPTRAETRPGRPRAQRCGVAQAVAREGDRAAYGGVSTSQ